MLLDPVVGERFFGRGDIIALLEKRLDGLKSGYRQNVAITGHRLTGKSSILNQLLFTFRDDGILPVYIEVTNEPFRQFAVKFIGTLLYNFLRHGGKEAKDDLEYLIKGCEKDIPETVSSVKNVLKEIQANSNDSAYAELLSLSSLLKNESGKRCVVILDEFHNLSALGIKDPFRGFGKKIMTQKDTMYIVASSEVTSIKKILSEKLALLFGNFEKITLGGFDYETSRAFLRKKLSTVKIADDLLDFLTAFADGHPFYLDVLSSKINEVMGNLHFRVVGVTTVVKAMEELLFDARGTLNQFFTNLLQDVAEPAQEPLKKTLTALAHGIYKRRELCRWTGLNVREVSGCLKILIEKSVIYPSGNIYRLYDKVMRFWLRNVYHKRRRTLVDNISERSKMFQGDAECMIGQFLAEAALDTSVRVKALFDSFNNEIVKIGPRTRRLMRFEETEIVESGGKRYIIGRLRDKFCVAHFSNKKIDENDILEFIKYTLRYKPRLKRRILLPLDGIDINANIMAKEVKMTIWGLAEVNELLDITGRQKIVRI